MIPITRSIVSTATKGVPTLKDGSGFLLEFGFFVSKGLVADWSADSSTISSHDALLMRKLSLLLMGVYFLLFISKL